MDCIIMYKHRTNKKTCKQYGEYMIYEKMHESIQMICF